MTEPTDDLIDYEDEDEVVQTDSTALNAVAQESEAKKGSYVGVHATGFRDFLLKPELLRAIVDCGFEHPSEGIIWINEPSNSLKCNKNVFLRLF